MLQASSQAARQDAPTYPPVPCPVVIKPPTHDGGRLPTLARADLLELPHTSDLHRIFRYESGLLLDRYLKRSSRLSGAIDRGLALRLSRLRQAQGFRRLGYSCFGDYVRQRIDLAERTAQEMVRLGRALQRLPLLDSALADGRITWTAAAQVAGVADPGDEKKWVRQAETLSVRALKRLVKQQSSDGTPSEASSTADAGSNSTTDNRPDLEAEDRCVKLSVLASPRAARIWAAALELCRLTAGAPLSEAEACEYLLADFLSGAEPVATEFQAYPLNPPLTYPPRSKAGANGDGGHAQPPSHRRKQQGCPSEELGTARVDLSAVKLSPETIHVLEFLENEPPTDPFELDASLRSLIAARRSLDLDLARLLRIFRQLGLARHVGFPDFAPYVEERLAISVHRANFLARLDRALTSLEATRQAIRQGRIGTVAALLIARVAGEDSERAWIERAGRVTVLRLREEVRWAERENAMTHRRDAKPPSIGSLPSELQTMTVALLSDAASRCGTLKGQALERLHPFEGASAWVRCDVPLPGGETNSVVGEVDPLDCGSNPAGDRPDHGHETFALHDRVASGFQPGAVAQAVRVYREMFAGDDGDARPVTVRFWLRRCAVSLWTAARRAMAAATGIRLVNDAQVLYDVALAFLRSHMPAWLEAVLRGDPIAVRDRFACQVPGCTQRVGSAHHLRFVSQQGPDEPWNLLFLCWTHHILGIHGGGWLRVSGRAPDALCAELGLDSRGVPLETWTRGPFDPKRVATS